MGQIQTAKILDKLGGSPERKQELEAQGYVNLGVIDPDIDTLAVAEKIGSVVKISGVPAVQSLTPKYKKETPPNIYSGNFGLKEFPLHTDLAHWYIPPRFFILRAKVPAPDVSTMILHYAKFLKDVPSKLVSRALFKPRRKLDNKLFLLRLVSQGISRWDEIFISPENDSAKCISEYIKNKDFSTVTDKISFMNKGETLLVDNWKVLHGRSKVPQGSMNRTVERVYLSEMSN
ncbi:MAG: hypothetical protein IH886_12585 [Nitrospinae bacterium]|nr:hypothetical protein [Nitrospinota bacterium]